MPITAAFAVPHPPLIIPAVGRGGERKIARTVSAYERVADQVVAHMPEVVIVSSPHAPAYSDAFYVSSGAAESGSMARFGAPQERIQAMHDQNLAQEVARLAQQAGIPVAAGGPRDAEMDHGTFIPLWFVDRALERAGFGPGNYLLLRVGLSGLDLESHRAFGRVIAQAVSNLGRRAVFLASGDLAHALKPDGPYGFAPEAPEYDRLITHAFDGAAGGTLEELFAPAFTPAFCNAAGDCGHRSFLIMHGALGPDWRPELLSYEGPFGVGYMVAQLSPEPADAAASTEPQAGGESAAGSDAAAEPDATPDPLVALARASVEHYVRTGRPLPLPADLPSELTNRRAGAFVSLHTSDLRGCIGAIEPTKATLAEEIIANGVAACSKDPRFPAVTEDELDLISYSVDVLGAAEPIDGLDQLDPQRYGVIVTSGWRRGLLLPALEGVDTAELQVQIARSKAGIGPHEAVQLERFEVVRHTRGGEARRA
ncbi:MAG: AmmeMemoRadiSam system protein A [Coriobacteriia bacterium]|nr:AmmeMemoRadiSam system protein A [Coriobacteriia bacterium]